MVPTMAFNLFSDSADFALADRAVRWWRTLWRCLRGHWRIHGPLDPAYLTTRAFDAAFVLDLGDGMLGIVGVDVNYHEWAKPAIPKPRNLGRNLEVAERSGVFAAGATEAVKGRSELCVMWLEHLLLLSMLQHVSDTWRWCLYVVVHPAGNTDVAEACARYRALSWTVTFSRDRRGLLNCPPSGTTTPCDVLPELRLPALDERAGVSRLGESTRAWARRPHSR
jgi:hypothetical protein